MVVDCHLPRLVAIVVLSLDVERTFSTCYGTYILHGDGLSTSNHTWNFILGDKPTDYKVYCDEYMDKIENLMGDKSPILTSWYWWKYKLNRTFKEWVNWYMWGEDNDYTN